MAGHGRRWAIRGAAGMAAAAAVLALLCNFWPRVELGQGSAPPPAGIESLPNPASRASGPALLAMQASIEEIERQRPAVPTLYQLRGTPRIFVLDFPDMEAQGSAMNRVAALVEKAGLPRDRVLPDDALAAAIAAAGDTPATFYFAHNYRLRDLERFFALADRDRILLNDAEGRLREAVGLIRRLVPDGNAALLTVPAAGAAMAPDARGTMLAHEFSHGVYFTDPAYAAGVLSAWREGFTEAERGALRRWLASEGYDPGMEELMANETQAYLLHTSDQRFFRPELVGLAAADLDRLRQVLRSHIARAGGGMAAATP